MLFVKKVIILEEYLDFADIFLKKLVEVLLECTGINKHAIELQKGKQLSHGPIYSLNLAELETLKTYIEINLTNSFIRLLKSSAGASIILVQKLDGSLRLYVNYQGLNNLTIKNRYFFTFNQNVPRLI